MNKRKCSACGETAERTIRVSRRDGKGQRTVPACNTCYCREHRGGNFWVTAKKRALERERQSALARALASEGKQLRDIARALGISGSTVMERLKQ